MASKKKDASSFEGNGISFKAKVIGIEEVAEARGDLLCQEAITRLKNSVKASGQHKQKVFINVTLEGLKIIDAISLLVLHTHPVHKISFISRDTTDNRAFGYIIGSGEGKHTFFAIKTAAAAEQLVLTLRDLFQVVYEMKKKEMDEAKDKLKESSDDTTQEITNSENEKPSGEGSTSEEAQTQNGTQIVDGDGIYHVPSNNARKPSIAEQQANLLDLEDQADSILKGIEQIKNLDFDSLKVDDDKVPGSPLSPPPSQASGTADPWASPAAAAPLTAQSNLGDLAGIQTGPFVNMQQQQAFAGGAFPGPIPGYNMSAAPAMRLPNSGLPVTRDPFGTDPFAGNFQQPGVRPAGFAMPGYGVANPFGAPAFGPAFQGVRPQVPPGMAAPPGMFPISPPAANPNPFATFNAPEDPNMLKPLRTDQQGQEASQEQEKGRSKSPREDLFGDLLGIKKSTNDAKTPKDMFAQLNSADKKSMNAMKNPAEMPTQNTNASPFGDAFGAQPPATNNKPSTGALLD